MTHQPPGRTRAQVQTLTPSLLPAEAAVARVLLERDDIAELSSRHVAELAGCSRATVVRACQSLGYTGWQQLRVLLARDAALLQQGRVQQAGAEPVSGPAGVVLHHFHRLAETAQAMASLLDPDQLEAAVDLLATAPRVMVVANGLTAPLAVDLQARLLRLGIDASHHHDVLQQHIAAANLPTGAALVVISGSGANSHTLTVARAASEVGACLLVITAFARSPLAGLADVLLLVSAPGTTFGTELTETSRIPQAVLIEGLGAALRDHLGERATPSSARTLHAVSSHLEE
ncbi:MAG TPA: MurR/RpiR family transcriptional regulator [Candidatus Avipropionibacterium avicola]|uniref:MurR/RpiR family transcriptional regulator n=1 Tax=Candidatus Avipropionibacterium avicola TaxID=2840701 RepID=A0A9D1GVV9_9ACTN|nr:MurR/RpiR family transcriptional regulator [Candidatus Avipropionibacterium avicola]